MKNREWLLNKMQNMSDEELADLIHVPPKMDEEVCDLLGDCFPRECIDCKTAWLKEEHKEKITLSEAERIILESLEHEYWYIAKNKNGNLIIFLGVPRKEKEEWNSRGFKFVVLNCFNHLFQFIKWEDEQAYNIQKLLKGE